MEERSEHSEKEPKPVEKHSASESSDIPESPKNSAASDTENCQDSFGIVTDSENAERLSIHSDESDAVLPDDSAVITDEPEAPHPLTVRSDEPTTDITHVGTPLSRLEAVLFLAKEPWNTRRLAQYAQIEDGSQVRRLIGELNESYRARQYPFRILGAAGGYQLMTRPQFGEWLRKIHRKHYAQLNLSPTALETLAIIAYNQPVLRVDIEAVRGFQCSEMLHSLMERNLVRIVARSDDLGRPYLYGTTKKFLAVYGLNSLDELPGKKFSKKSEQIGISAKGPVIEPAIKNPVSEKENDSLVITDTISTNNSQIDSGGSKVDSDPDQKVLLDVSDTTETNPQEESQMLHKMNNRSVFGENESADFSDLYSPYQENSSSVAVIDSDDEDDEDDEDDDWDEDDEDEDDDWDDDDEDWDDEDEDEEDWEDDDEWEVVEDDDDEDWDEDDEDEEDDEDDEDWDDEDWGDDDEEDENN